MMIWIAELSDAGRASSPIAEAGVHSRRTVPQFRPSQIRTKTAKYRTGRIARELPLIDNLPSLSVTSYSHPQRDIDINPMLNFVRG